MKEFITNYVKMILDIRGVSLNETDFNEIIENVYNYDSMWDELDYYINSQIDKKED